MEISEIIDSGAIQVSQLAQVKEILLVTWTLPQMSKGDSPLSVASELVSNGIFFFALCTEMIPGDNFIR